MTDQCVPSSLRAYVDGELKITIDPVTNFWDFAGLDDSIDNPWITGDKMAPFDRKVDFCHSYVFSDVYSRMCWLIAWQNLLDWVECLR